MIPRFTLDLNLSIWKTNVNAHKIDDILLRTYRITRAAYFVKDKSGQVWFFKETFLLTDTSIEVILGMPFFFFSNIDIKF